MDSLSTEVESSELFNLLADSVGLGSTDDMDNGLNQPRVPMATAKKTGQDSAAEADAKRGSRGNYLCSKCKVPKKGHVCPYQPKYVRREKNKVSNAAVQAEIDEHMTVRQLPLATQGLPESYQPPAAGFLSMTPP